MKQKDLALIIVLGLIAALIGWVISEKIFRVSAKRTTQVEVITPISAEFSEEGKELFQKVRSNFAVPVDPNTLGGNSNPFTKPK